MKKAKGRKIIITGGTGFIGANLTHYFLKNGYNIHLLVRKDSNYRRIETIKDRLDIHVTDLTNLDDLKKIFKKIQPDYIFHLASYGNYNFQQDKLLTIESNITAIQNLLEASRDINYKLFINSGSSSEYGNHDKPLSENTTPKPNTLYAITKLIGTNISSEFGKTNNKPVITFRFFSVYGPYEEKTRLIPTVINNLKTHKPIQLTPGKIRRDFIFTEDIITAYKCAMSSKIYNGEIYNLGSGKQYTNDEVVDTIVKIMHLNTKINKGAYPKRVFDSGNWVAKINKSKTELNWKPEYDLYQGLKKTIAHMKDDDEQKA